MNVVSLFAFTVFAAETVISPIPDPPVVPVEQITKPEISFGEIIATPTPAPPHRRVAEEATTPSPRRRGDYTIALLGDSMIDTLGPGVPALQSLLKNSYPGTTFTILNYGVGATNIDYGIERITNDYTYLGNRIPSLASTHPDIVVLESFAYNPFSDPDGGVNRHWLAMARAVDTLRASIPGVKIIIAATIAPQISDAISESHASVIRSYLESTIAFAKSQGLPLVDAYYASIPAYTNPGDHIHYSDSGRAFFAQKVAATLQSVL